MTTADLQEERVGAQAGFVWAVGANAIVWIAAWSAATTHRGAPRFGAPAHRASELFVPVGAFLTLWAGVGLVCLFVRSRRRFGAGVILGTFAAALLDAAWIFAYFVTHQG